MSKGQRISQPDLVRDPPNKTAEDIEDLEIQLKEALDRQVATAKILNVVNSSIRDAQPVFYSIVEAG